MSFFGLFEDNLSDRSQVHFDLAKIHLDKGQYLQALDALDQIESAEKEHKHVKELKEQISEALEQSLDEDQEDSSPQVTELSGDRLLLQMVEFDQETVQEYTDQGYHVEATCFGDQWIIIFKNPTDSDTSQQYLLLETIEEDSFQDYHNEGFFITQLASDGDSWFFVFEKRENWIDQRWIANPNGLPKDEFKAWEEEGLMMDLILEVNGVFFGTAVQFEDPAQLESVLGDQDPTDVVPAIWDEEKWVIRLFSFNDTLLYYFKANDSISDQSCLVDEQFPLQELEKRFADGQSLAQLRYTQYGWIVLTDKKKVLTENEAEEETENLEHVLQELNALVGLSSVKKEFHQLVDYLKIGKIKEEQGIQTQQLSLHMVFRGNPGTGKTTVARLVGRVFKSLGFLSKGHVVETDRSGLVGEYVGQTAKKTNDKLDEAMGGILFVDEAYALKSDGKSDFGGEALETILKRMEDQRDQLIVIFAGYPNEMDELLESNPGLKSRFATHLNFEDFSAEELLSILKKMLVKSSHFLTVNAEHFATKYLQFITDTSDRYFGNAREVRNLFEDLLKSQSSRLAKKIAEDTNSTDQLSYEALRQIHLEDLRACYQFDYEEYHEETLEDILQELNELIGLGNIKQEIQEMANYIEVLKRRKESGLSTEMPGMHAVFMGAPGTGKTTVARLLARIYKSLGIIKKETLVEVSRQDLVAEYVGQTAVKTNKLIDKAMHGVLFIDEAYALTSKGQNDFGQEAIEVLLKRMEDDRDKFVVIVAGYPQPMTTFLESNPGLPSRFNKKYTFEDFSEEELQEIFLFYLKKSSYTLEKQADELLLDRINEKLRSKTKFFGNARWVRKLFEACKVSQAQRLSTLEFINEDDLQLLTVEDLENAFVKLKQM